MKRKKTQISFYHTVEQLLLVQHQNMDEDNQD